MTTMAKDKMLFMMLLSYNIMSNDLQTIREFLHTPTELASISID